ncbi:CHASE2 domain-containing protein [Pseudodesulfovibrio cashew]|uniref:CHASE2 domain-containing protein n=1 Tax=Pseudodesulfovibrio cashew TaxID=2678688 RepID=A0A6I6JLI3_9BACT|nr:adenylate/guanylate cyclase domain-containing protein [Pseudodesulfovibrio cashew]QGY41113.1 CHASE2 domain-containing protein [Pseudodesulfovibrio cashew]
MIKQLDKDRLLLLCIGLAATLLMSALFKEQPSFIRYLDYKAYDSFMNLYHSDKSTDVPVIVDIDEKSLAILGQWPWPRYRVAMLLKLLQGYGAAAVATDIIFVEPDKTSPKIIRRQLKKELKVDINIGGLPPALEDNDKLLADNLRTGPFILGIDFLSRDVNSTIDFTDLGRECFIPPANVATHRPKDAPSPHQALLKADEVICPLSTLAMAAPKVGFITIGADHDSIYRRVPLLFSWNEKLYPSLALAAIMQATGEETLLLKMSTNGVESLRLGDITIPTDMQGRMLINYRGPSRTFEYISAADVLGGRLKLDALKGRIVFVGTSASGLKDIRATPLDPSFPGVEAHATIVDNILSKQFLKKPDWGIGLEFSAMAAAGLLTTLLLLWTGAAWMAVPLVIMGAGIWYGSVYFYTKHLLYVSPVYAFFNLILTFTLVMGAKFWREERAKRFIHGAFAHYLAPSVISQIMERPDALTLEGQEKEVTIQFSDIRGFTALSEKLTPAQVTDLLHDYLTPMTTIITDYEGTLDKFIGDAIMAFWNAPLDTENHQEKGLTAAFAQLERLETLNEIFRGKYGFSIRIGIGLHSGPVRVGNMGSEHLFDYTIIGDSVNLASRLEGLTKFYGQKLIVSQSIVDACSGGYRFRVLDSVRVKGKREPVTIYTVYSEDSAANRAEELARYEEALNLYRQKRFTEAHQAFKELDGLGTEPLLYALYMDRCRLLEANPPEAEWDGVFTHEKK